MMILKSTDIALEDEAYGSSKNWILEIPGEEPYD